MNIRHVLWLMAFIGVIYLHGSLPSHSCVRSVQGVESDPVSPTGLSPYAPIHSVRRACFVKSCEYHSIRQDAGCQTG